MGWIFLVLHFAITLGNFYGKNWAIFWIIQTIQIEFWKHFDIFGSSSILTFDTDLVLAYFFLDFKLRRKQKKPLRGTKSPKIQKRKLSHCFHFVMGEKKGTLLKSCLHLPPHKALRRSWKKNLPSFSLQWCLRCLTCHRFWNQIFHPDFS